MLTFSVGTLLPTYTRIYLRKKCINPLLKSAEKGCKDFLKSRNYVFASNFKTDLRSSIFGRWPKLTESEVRCPQF